MNKLFKIIRSREFIILCIIFSIALILRIYNLGSVPRGFHLDELDAGYVGRYIFIHGKDVFGNPWPLYFNKFGDYRPIGIFYVAGLLTYIFGLNEFAIRLSSALFGSLTIFPLFYLSTYLFGNKRVGYAGALALAIMPWHIVLSRATSEGIIGVFFICLGLGLLVHGVQKSRTTNIVLGGVTLLISYLFYHSFRFLIPLMVLPFVMHPILKNHTKRVLLILLFCFSLLSLLLFVTKSGGGRFSQVAFYKNPILSNTSDSLIFGEGNNNVFVARAFHNKLVLYTREFINQYVQYFSPQYLFMNGGLPYRYVVPEQGLLYITFIPLLILGFAHLFSTKNLSFARPYILYLLAIAPIPASLTIEDSPNVHRSLLLMVPLAIVVGLGLEQLFTKHAFNKKLTYIPIVLIIITGMIELIYFVHQYTIHTATTRSYTRNDGIPEVMRFVLDNKTKYNSFIIPIYDELPMYYLYYTKQFPILPRNLLAVQQTKANIDNIEFRGIDCPSKDLNIKELKIDKILIIDKGDCDTSPGFTEVKLILRTDSTKAYRILVPVKT